MLPKAGQKKTKKGRLVFQIKFQQIIGGRTLHVYDLIIKIKKIKQTRINNQIGDFWDARWQQTYQVNPLFTEMFAWSERCKQWKSAW